MKTQATKDFPEIEWQQGELAEEHDHLNIYAAYGESTDGRAWIASWQEVDGQFDEIINIEEGDNCKHFWIDSKTPDYYVCTKCGLETNDYEQYYPYKDGEYVKNTYECYHCTACMAMLEEECCCNESEED